MALTASAKRVNIQRSLDAYVHANLKTIEGLNVDFRGVPFDNAAVSEWISPRVLDITSSYAGLSSSTRYGEDSNILFQINIAVKKGGNTRSDRDLIIRDIVANYFKVGQDILVFDWDSSGSGLFNLVTDGGFGAITATNSYTSDFSGGVHGFTATRTTIAAPITIGGEDNSLRMYADASNDTHEVRKEAGLVAGNCYRLRYDYYIPSANTTVKRVNVNMGGVQGSIGVTLDAWTSVDEYFNATTGTNLRFTQHSVTSPVFIGANLVTDDLLYIKNGILDAITLTSWTAGTGWAPQATAGALTNKARKVAGTASAIEQDINAKNNISYPLAWTNDQSTSGKSINAEIGGVDGVTQTTDATITDYIRATGTGNLKFEAADDWAGTIDTVSIPIEGYLRVREITTDMSLPETETTYDCAVAFELSYTRETAAP